MQNSSLIPTPGFRSEEKAPDRAARRRFEGIRRHWAFRYGLAIALFAATLGLSLGLSRAGIKISLTIPMVMALVGSAWYGGLGPGILISVLFQAAMIIYTPIPQGTSLPQAIFGYFSVLSLMVFLSAVINHLRKTQSRLREQRDLLQVTLSGLGDAVIAADSSGSVKFINPAAQELTGFNAVEAVGRQVEQVARIVTGGLEAAQEVSPSTTVLKTGKAIGLTNNSSLIGKDGRTTSIAYSAAPLQVGNASEGVVLVISDVTARMRSKALAERRSREIAALYEFTHRSQLASSIDEVYDAAIESIFVSLVCDRAAVLLFDQNGVMQFVATRGLSEEYKAAVAGHTPWRPDEKGARPVSVEDVESDEIDPAVRSAIRKEGIAALGFIPLLSNEKLIGKLMVYFDQPHTFSESEFEIAMTVGNQIAAGLERKRAEARLLENEERLRLATQTGKVGVWDWDIDTGRVEWTDALYPMHGVEKGEFDGSVEMFSQLVHPDDRAMVSESIRKALEEDEPYDLEFKILRPDGGISWLITNAVVLRNESGPYRMLGATADITEMIMAQSAKRESEIMHRIIDAQEAERRRIARDLHDHLGQKMTALRLRMEAAVEKCSGNQEATLAIRELQSSALSIDQDIGFLSWELRPTELENLGLANALGTFVREWSAQHGVQGEFRTTKSNLNGSSGERMDPVIELNLYRIAQEALNNVLKHADANSVSVLLHRSKEKIKLIVEDNGKGFDYDTNSPDIQSRHGLGVVGMQERAALLNGNFEIDSFPGKGTTVLVEVPSGW